jgi:hypothetical protein
MMHDVLVLFSPAGSVQCHASVWCVAVVAQFTGTLL